MERRIRWIPIFILIKQDTALNPMCFPSNIPKQTEERDIQQMSLNVESCKERLISTQRAYAAKELKLQIDEIRYTQMKYFNWNLIIYEKDIVYDDNHDKDDYEIEVPEYHKDIALERFMVGKKKTKNDEEKETENEMEKMNLMNILKILMIECVLMKAENAKFDCF